jgi:hypothetical protein
MLHSGAREWLQLMMDVSGTATYPDPKQLQCGRTGRFPVTPLQWSGCVKSLRRGCSPKQVPTDGQGSCDAVCLHETNPIWLVGVIVSLAVVYPLVA